MAPSAERVHVRNSVQHNASAVESGEPASMPIAIVGISCNFPGEATSPEKLWKMLVNGQSAWSEIPSNRFDKDAFYHPQGDRSGTSNVRGGHFLKEDIATFDASFFNFTAEAARTMDPQFRLQLESVFEALESAGISIDDIAETNTSVFAGAFFHDFWDSFMKDTDTVPRQILTGNGTAMASNRISHFFALKGPSLSVDTGCSTSLAALHLACQSIKTGESKTSIVGGSNVIINPDMFIALSNLGLLGPSGKCFSFDSRAEGYGRGEGVATIILKSLAEALENGDPIRAVIRETALNQDGKTSTITSPSQEAQEELIRTCYRNAGLDPAMTSYVEAHGTGTKVGDRIESMALGTVFGENRSATNPLLIGSIKSNIGHLESTSGLAGIIKVVLALENGFIPPTINFEKPNPKIDFKGYGLKIASTLQEWPSEQLRRASVSSFGYGGTNAHVIIEHPSHLIEKFRHPHSHSNGALSVNGRKASSARSSQNEMPRVFTLSGNDESAAMLRIQQLREYLEASPELAENVDFLKNLSFTLNQRRSKLPWSIAVSAKTREELVEKLHEASVTKSAAAVPRIGFVFTGQGAQWYAMARELIETYPSFASSLREADSHLQDLGAQWSLVQELLRDEKSTRVNEPELSFPVCVALQVCLVQLLDSWGVRPTTVTGHSSGEIAAAYAAGAINLREALAIAYVRGVLTQKHVETTAVPGSMMAVALGLADALPFIKDFMESKQAVIGCVNSPASVTLSGNTQAIEELSVKFAKEEIFVRQLKVRAAYHSPHMAPLAKKYLTSLKKVLMFDEDEREFKGVLFSSPVTGKVVHNAAELGPAHWVANMVQPVLFFQSLHNMILPDSGSHAVDILVEIGPHGALAGPIRQTLALPELKDLGIAYGFCLSRGTNAVESLQNLVCVLTTKGYRIDYEAMNFPQGIAGISVITDLPSYPWNHSIRYWEEPISNNQLRARKHPPHDLLGVVAKESNSLAPTWRHVIRVSDVPWVRDHVIQNKIVYPAAGMICMVIEAMKQLSATLNEEVIEYIFRDVDIMRAIVIDDSVDIHLSISKCNEDMLDTSAWKKFHIYSSSAGNQWFDHCKGFVFARTKSASDEAPDWSSSTQNCPQTADSIQGCVRGTDPADFFSHLRAFGVEHGPLFQNIVDIVAWRGYAISTFRVPNTKAMMPHEYEQEHVIHPITLDSIFQLGYAPLNKTQRAAVGTAVPRSFKSMRLSADISNVPDHLFKNHTKLLNQDSQGFDIDFAVVDAIEEHNAQSATPIVQLSDVHYQSFSEGPNESASEDEGLESRLCLELVWERDITLMAPDRVKELLTCPPDVAEITKLSNLRRATYMYIHDALKELSATDIQNLEWHHKALYEWMNLQAAQASRDELAPQSSKWANISPGVKQMLFDKVSAESINGAAVCTIGENLLPILRREIAPLDLLMKDKLLHRLYENILRAHRSSSQIAKLVKLHAHKNPRSKVLEIGAGTGTGTLSILKALGGGDTGIPTSFAQYDFTDISAGFFDDAREKLVSWGDLIQYQQLDIEKDPTEQGFENESYDLIVSVQCLHATTSMRRTMTHVRKLLKEGGKLIIMETTQDTSDAQLIFGTLPGWWLSMCIKIIKYRRPNTNENFIWIVTANTSQSQVKSPSVKTVQTCHSMWETVLLETGFTGIDLEVPDCEDKENYSFSVIMSTAAMEKTSIQPLYPQVAIVHGQPAPPQAWLNLLVEIISEITSRRPKVADLYGFEPNNEFCIFVGDVNQTIFNGPDEVAFYAVKKVALHSEGLIWVSRGASVEGTKPQAAMHHGFLRSLRCEYSSKYFVSLDLDPKRAPWTDESAKAISTIFRSTIEDMPNMIFVDHEYALRDNTLMVPRVKDDLTYSKIHQDASATELQAFVQPGRELRLEVGTYGLLDSLRFANVTSTLECPETLQDDFLEIEPKAFGLNFRDVMVAMGQMQPRLMGFECSGVVTRVGAYAATKYGFQQGDRVMALTSGNGWASSIRVPYTSVGRLPQNMSYEVAASMPTVWVTAYHALINVARLKRGEKILIHAATGGVGQAAIMLAKYLNAEIFCTVGTVEKRDFIMDTYDIPRDHIWSSRNASFAADLLTYTQGRGVDVVLNSLADPLLEASWKCVAALGRFVEIGKRDIQANKSLPMEAFQRAVSFSAIDILQMAHHRGQVVFEIMNQVLQLYSQNAIGSVAPVTTYPISEVQSAFRKMQAGQHMGKIVILPKPGDRVPVLPSKLKATFYPENTYIIVGGVQGLGQAIAQWAVDRGARNLILLSRSIASRKDAIGFAELLAKEGCKIKLASCDVSDWSKVAQVMREANQKMPPVRGVIYGAVVLDDSILESMTLDQWNAAVRPKVQGTLNLHNLLVEQKAKLDFFIMLSSIAGFIGNASQTNYAAGCTFQDAFARCQRNRGLPYLAIDLGVVRGLGLAARTKGAVDHLLRQGHLALDEDDVINVIEHAVMRLTKGQDVTTNDITRDSSKEPLSQLIIRSCDFSSISNIHWRADARFLPLKRLQSTGNTGSHKKAKTSDSEFRASVTQCSSFSNIVDLIATSLISKLSEMFIKPVTDFDPSQPLSKHGVDSLVAVELRNWLSSTFKADVNLLDVLQSDSLRALAELVTNKSRTVAEAGFESGNQVEEK